MKLFETLAELPIHLQMLSYHQFHVIMNIGIKKRFIIVVITNYHIYIRINLNQMKRLFANTFPLTIHFIFFDLRN